MGFRFLFILLIFISCGKDKRVTGGPLDLIQPEVIATTPMHLSEIENNIVEITFSKPIDRKSFAENHYFFPNFKEKIRYKNNTIIIHFQDSLLSNTNYHLKLSNSIKGQRGNFLNSDYHFTFFNGKLNNNRLKGDFSFEKNEDSSSTIILDLMLKDSTLVQRREITGHTFDLEFLNENDYILEAFADNNENGIFNFEKEPKFRTDFFLKGIKNIEVELTYTDSILPEVEKITTLSNREIEIDFSEIIVTKGFKIFQNDSLLVPLEIFYTNIYEDKIRILTQVQDTVSYLIIFDEISDLKNNIVDSLGVEFLGSSLDDLTSPNILSVTPKTGNSLYELKPKISILSDEIIIEKMFNASFVSEEFKYSVDAKIISSDGFSIILEPKTNLKNYASYTLEFSNKNTDFSGNYFNEFDTPRYIILIDEK